MICSSKVDNKFSLLIEMLHQSEFSDTELLVWLTVTGLLLSDFKVLVGR